LLDLYSQRIGTIVHLPGLGILCGGVFGSDALLPQLAPGSDGSEELDALRLLARLVKGSRLQVYIPKWGSLAENGAEVLRRLANDVAYLHNLRRVIPALGERADQQEHLATVAASLLPAERASSRNQTVNQANIRTVLAAARP
ncbi:MAG TPA: hypothetical protein PKE45_15250, partial [Caldilineaceae bacterium]|nr:hypothetical protein [Caldilineaceae bacterium]